MTIMNSSSRKAMVVTLCQLYSPKLGIGAKCVSEDLENPHFSTIFRHFIEGTIILLLFRQFPIIVQGVTNIAFLL